MHIEEIHTLEALIDRYTFKHVALELAILAEEKAKHIRENWQDDKLAKHWQLAADRITHATEGLVV